MGNGRFHRLNLGSRPGVGRRRLLITGTPGTGKRQLGAYLEMQRGFVHVDLDSRSSRATLLRSGNEGLEGELSAIIAEHPKVVVTWTFTEETQLSYVETIQELGFEWIWTDCDQGAAFDALIAARPNLKLPRFIDPFENDGSFRALETFTAEVRRRRPMARPRFRVPVPTLPKPAWAGIVALAAAAASAAGAYIAGAFPTPQPVRVAHAAATHVAHSGTFPVDGLLVPGRSLAGVSLGDTTAQVRKLWGTRFTVCDGCKPTTWFYWSPTGGSFGAGLTLRSGRVTAVFTLGSPTGWHMAGGPRVGQLLDRFNDPGNATQQTCKGYGATSTRSGRIVTSILTQGQAVYGFALTRPSETVCH